MIETIQTKWVKPADGYVICEQCGERHVAEYDHDGLYGEGPIFAVICTQDWLTDYFTAEGIMRDAR